LLVWLLEECDANQAIERPCEGALRFLV
jgi:hypothetical protein